MPSFTRQVLQTALGSSDNPDLIAITLFISLLCMCIVVGHLSEGNRWLNESVMAILFLLRFNEELFFIYLLPPIIFNAGFQVKKKQFFKNFSAIMTYGVIGVFISFGVITAGLSFACPFTRLGSAGLPPVRRPACLPASLGAVFSATDSVSTLQDEFPLLYSLVFGEGVVNDASSVVLFRAVQKFTADSFVLGSIGVIAGNFAYLFAASTLLGVAVGLASAFIIKTLYLGRHSTDREVALMALMAYLSYVISDLLGFSGILTVFFCGVVMSHYTWHNVTESSRVTTKHGFATMSFIAETFIFIYVGMDALDTSMWAQTRVVDAFGMFACLVVLTVLGRAAFVYPLSALINLRRRNTGNVLTLRHQTVILWAGLMRGAVSIALTFSAFTHGGVAMEVKHATIISSTIAVVLFSTMVLGMLTRPFLDWILPCRHPSLEHDVSEPDSPKDLVFSDSLLAPLTYGGGGGSLEDGDGRDSAPPLSPLALLTQRGTNLGELLSVNQRDVHALWRWFDDTYMRPLFGGRGFVPYTPGSPTVGGTNEYGIEALHMTRRDPRRSSARLLSFRDDRGSLSLAEADHAWPDALSKPSELDGG
eukprot:jgi/Mesen1/5114/ME000255S04087